MELTVIERLALQGLLPEKADFVTLRIIRELKESLSFDEEELEALGFKYDDEGRVNWKIDGETHKDFEFGRAAREVVEKALKDADKAKKLTLDHLSLYEKVLGDESEPEPLRKYG